MAALLELRSASNDHIWLPVGFAACTGLGTLLELWLDSPCGLVGLLGVSEGSPAAEPFGVEYCSSRRLVVKKLVLRESEPLRGKKKKERKKVLAKYRFQSIL